MSLHTLHDGSNLRVMDVKELISIPVWKGNRIINHDHVENIKRSVGNNIKKLDFGFRIVTYEEKDAGGNLIKNSCVIDGQHRHKVLTDHFNTTLCEQDFPVIVLERFIKDESEIITYFKELNNQLAIPWKSDPNILANNYIHALCLAFNQKETLIRQKTTTRPYLSTEKLREKLVEIGGLCESPEMVRAFVERVRAYNEKELKEAHMLAMYSKNPGIIEKAHTHKFMLAVNTCLPWIKECLQNPL